MWKGLGLDKLHARGMASMQAERAKVDGAGKTMAKLNELDKILSGGTGAEKKLDGMEKKQEEKDQRKGKGKDDKEELWTIDNR